MTDRFKTFLRRERELAERMRHTETAIATARTHDDRRKARASRAAINAARYALDAEFPDVCNMVEMTR